jgi:L-lactate dehydrogenase complex protein LldE
LRVALFIACVGDTLFPAVGKAAVGILDGLGHEAAFPPDQTCCGQLHANSGYREGARALARRVVRIFDTFDAIVAPSSSCAGTVRELYPELVREAGDERLAQASIALGSRVFELSELVFRRLGVEDVGAFFPHRVTYHPTCHSLLVARVGDAPLRLLRAVRGLELVELPEADECCGFGGTFDLKNADTSLAMLADKCRSLVATAAEVCTGVDASCLLQIGGGLGRDASPVRTLHLAEILAATEVA